MNVTAEIIEEGSDGAQQRTSYDLRGEEECFTSQYTQ